MKGKIRRIICIVLSATILGAFGFAQDKESPNESFERAFKNSDAVKIHKLKTPEVPKYSDISESTNSIGDMLNTYIAYNIYMPFEEKFHLEITKRTTARKAELGYERSVLSNNYELNSKYIQYKNLQLQTTSAKCDLEIAREKMELERLKYEKSCALLKAGQIDEITNSLAKNAYEQAKITHSNAVIAFDENYNMLRFYLGSDTVIEPLGIYSPYLKPFEEYLNDIDKSFAIASLINANLLLGQDMKIYNENLSKLDDDMIRTLKDMNNKYKRNEADIEIKRLEKQKQIATDYYSLITQVKNLQNLQTLYDTETKRAAQTEELYKLNRISDVDYKEFQIKYLELKYNFMKSCMQFDFLKTKFEMTNKL